MDYETWSHFRCVKDMLILLGCLFVAVHISRYLFHRDLSERVQLLQENQVQILEFLENPDGDSDEI